MDDSGKFLLVDTRALPDVFMKVVRAKRLFAQGKASTLSEAAKKAGISRSAFYKYKDYVFPYENGTASLITTIYAELLDEAGVLSSLLTALGNHGANIITINQNIPVDGVAPVSVSMNINKITIKQDELMRELKSLKGVVSIRFVSNS